MAPKEQEEGARSLFPGWHVCHGFCANFNCQVEMGLWLWNWFVFFMLNVIFTKQLPAGNVFLSAYTDTKRNPHVGLFDCQNCQFKFLMIFWYKVISYICFKRFAKVCGMYLLVRCTLYFTFLLPKIQQVAFLLLPGFVFIAHKDYTQLKMSCTVP